MPPKSATGSAKAAQAAAPAEQAQAAEENKENKRLVLPWQKDVDAWMGVTRMQQRQTIESLRKHYVEADGIISNGSEWRSSLDRFMFPFDNANCEKMVRALTTTLAHEGSRKTPADNTRLFQAALRCRHSELHFKRMYELFTSCIHHLLREEGVVRVEDVLDVFQGEKHITRDQVQAHLNTIRLGFEEPVEVEIKEKEFNPSDPFHILQRFLAINRLRLIDMFRAFDKDGSGNVSGEELLRGLKSDDAELDMEKMTLLINFLDKDGSGEIDYREFAAGRAEMILYDRINAMKQDTQPRERLGFTLEDFLHLILHCHYTTRP